MHFFFRLSERKRCQKERTPAVPVGLLRSAFSRFQPKGQKLASLKQSALFNGFKPPSASRPPVNAGEPCGIKPCYVETWRAASHRPECLMPNAAWLRLSGGA